MTQIKSVELPRKDRKNEFPFTLPFIQSFDHLTFSKPITILVGENGTGKSTFLEALATNAGSILIGGESIDYEPSLDPVRPLGDALNVTWKVRTKKGLFFRAEDFISFTTRIAEAREESQEKLRDIKEKDPHSLEALPYARTVHELKQLYGDGLEVRSHGESFLDLFQARFKPGGVYILDEPEAPLSPLKQLSLISMIKDMVKKDAQFIIATHSPILMALPDADIYQIEEGSLKKIAFEDSEHVKLTKDFLEQPERYLRHL
ncbi:MULTISPECIES: AAA family ATPase [Pontibacillus]|uniref:AAA family ATPase n=1 Tax=Pontibacillus chungwhensis TaxID=265426 RepID=A0ABY8UYT7_9BACI|nr:MULTISPECIES: AAA family ATPase [Pontibacillus]MCD5324874.1 AAA family ATPase [Pontibacillus sp. HN14]WIF98835.1 AAA family ATPase [Pontibacillus chungwhensis]